MCVCVCTRVFATGDAPTRNSAAVSLPEVLLPHPLALVPLRVPLCRERLPPHCPCCARQHLPAGVGVHGAHWWGGQHKNRNQASIDPGDAVSAKPKGARAAGWGVHDFCQNSSLHLKGAVLLPARLVLLLCVLMCGEREARRLEQR